MTTSKLFRCENCDFETDDEHDLDQITGGLFERVSAGEIYPAGQCPECGALCHICSKQVRLLDAAPEMIEVLRDILDSKGCSPCGAYTYVDSRKIAHARNTIAKAEREN